MGSAYLWEALQPGPRELSADVADFCFCQLLASLAQVLIFMRTFCSLVILYKKGSEKLNFQKFKDRAFNYDQTIFKVYGYGDNKKIKLVRMNYLKTKGIEIDDIEFYRGSANDSKIIESILRSKGKIFELAFCNPWQWFFTGTINPNKHFDSVLENEFFQKLKCRHHFIAHRRPRPNFFP